MQRLSVGVVAMLGLGVLVMVAGCGSDGPASLVGDPGGGSSLGTGSLTIAVKFPPRDTVSPKALPYATESVHITVEHGGSLVDEACVERPVNTSAVDAGIESAQTSGDTVTHTFANVPAGDNTVTANAYPASDGGPCTGTIIATASATLTVVAGQTNTVTLIAQPLVISGEAFVCVEGQPTGEPVRALARNTGETVGLCTFWYDADYLPLVPNDVAWSSSDDTVASVAADPSDHTKAVVTAEFAATGYGTCQITAAATPQGVRPTAWGDNGTPEPKIIIDVTVYATGDLEVIVEQQ